MRSLRAAAAGWTAIPPETPASDFLDLGTNWIAVVANSPDK